MLNQSFKFGIEIEFANANLREVENTMREAGVNVVLEGYNHTRRDHWKIVTDATVSTGGYSYATGQGDGGELVSPVLCGEDGLRELEAALAALNSHPAVSINRSCGLHVHLSWTNMQAEHIKEIVRRYAKFENQIDRWMPRSRRGSSCSWCSSTIDNSVDRVGDMSDLSARRAGMQRNCKVNLDAYRRHGTIEFRHHSGTTDFEKISNWIKFLIGFTEASNFTSLNATGGLDVNYKRKKRVAYGELREQLSDKGWSLDFAGGRGSSCRYNLKNSSGETVRNIYCPEMDGFYDEEEFAINGKRKLSQAAVDFWNELFGNTSTPTDELTAGIPNEIVNFYKEREIELN